MKRILDIIIATIALIILSPIFLLVCHKVKRNLGSPIFFYQERPGKDGKLFKMIKFRSMKDAFDQEGNPLPDEKRITPFGQKLRSTSLDEMPQLLNVLKGDMSIVGPRPMLKEFVELYSPEQARRLDVRPGMTGLAQVSGRNELDYEERFKCDVWYVDNHSTFVDFKIMFKTVKVMLKREGINAPGHVGPSLFEGNQPQDKRDKVKSS
ncbi:sugar transferase [Acinetobacter sp. NIPH 2377]|uniref:sugar transferase n=1 Tax=Acinetobacter terrestris TaxID=2529843 RepID=UPI0014901776|nr:sugar transferase [Acinetobacter terrestris]NNH34592.1 sugar transferase [Acinetobacter terrestris]